MPPLRFLVACSRVTILPNELIRILGKLWGSVNSFRGVSGHWVYFDNDYKVEVGWEVGEGYRCLLKGNSGQFIIRVRN